MTNKILIGVPCTDSIKAKTALSIYGIKTGETEVLFQVGADVARNRNKIVEHALANDFTHILFVDSDMKFPTFALHNLLAHDVDICGVLYHQRKLPLTHNVMPLEQEEIKGRYEIVDYKIPEDLFEARWVGTGIMLVKTDVFRKLKAPYFAFLYEDEYIGEDVYFCRKAREAGYRIFVDATLANRHVGEFEY